MQVLIALQIQRRVHLYFRCNSATCSRTTNARGTIIGECHLQAMTRFAPENITRPEWLHEQGSGPFIYHAWQSAHCLSRAWCNPVDLDPSMTQQPLLALLYHPIDVHTGMVDAY